jgi:circadian clock protein KaiC
MIKSNIESELNNFALDKSRTGIEGLDDIIGGGLPKGRPKLIYCSVGCGKTIFAMEFIIHGG